MRKRSPIPLCLTISMIMIFQSGLPAEIPTWDSSLSFGLKGIQNYWAAQGYREWVWWGGESDGARRLTPHFWPLEQCALQHHVDELPTVYYQGLVELDALNY